MPDELARRIGLRLRQVRWARGLLLKHVGRCMGVSWQQVQKYETGRNRISAANLLRLARFYGVSPAELLQCDEPVVSRETVELVRAYERLPERARATVRGLVQELGEPARVIDTDADSFEFHETVGW